MKIALGSLKVLVLVSLAVLLVVPGTIFAADFFSETFYISAQSEEEVSPSIAYNSQREEYLVVWYNDRPGCDDIRAQRLTKHGELISGPFYIAAECPAERRNPDVAYDSAHDQYLVVWEYSEISVYPSIKGRRVSGAGLVLDGTDITIRGGTNLYSPYAPAVAYASTEDRFLVVYEETWHPMPITWGIYGQKVIPSSGLTEGGQIVISENTSGSFQEPDIAYNHHFNRFLVVWQQDNGDWDIIGRQVEGNGTPWGGTLLVGWWMVDETAPAVAALPNSPTDDAFLVVWEFHYNSTDWDIYGHVVKEDGSMVGQGSAIAQYGGVIEASPAVAGSSNGRQYFVTWRYDHSGSFKPIRGQVVTYNENLTGQLQQALPTLSDADNPAVAAGPVGDFLVAWQDPRDTPSQNIYGRLYGNRIYIPMVLSN